MKIQYILHADFETPGALDDWARKIGATTSTSKPFAGDKIPSAEEFDCLIVMGGPQSPLEIDEYPFLKTEMASIKEAIDKGKIVLGFCLGAQLIAEALGGQTERSPHKEVGIYPINLTPEGMKDPIFATLPKNFDAVHWHYDMPGLPDGAVVLAESEGCPRQVMRFGEKVYGFQCHLEAKEENIVMMVENCPDDLQPGDYTWAMDALLEYDYSEINGWMHQILDNLAKNSMVNTI